MTRGDELQNAAGKRVQGQGIRAMKEKSEKLTRVAGIPIADVCVPCYGLLQQKKASQSYVPLRDAAKCVACGERRVIGAYLAYCPGCARERRICAKCGDAHGARRTATKEQSDLRALEAKLEEGDLKERERRTVLRQIERLKEKRRAEAAAQVSRHLAPCPNPDPYPRPNQVNHHLAPGSPCPDPIPNPIPDQREAAAREAAGEDEDEEEDEEGAARAEDGPKAFDFAVGDGPRQPLFNFMVTAPASLLRAGAADAAAAAAAADAAAGGGVSAQMGPQETQVMRELIGLKVRPSFGFGFEGSGPKGGPRDAAARAVRAAEEAAEEEEEAAQAAAKAAALAAHRAAAGWVPPEDRGGEALLFERKLTKEEKKAAAALKKAERDARKAAGGGAPVVEVD